MLSTANGIAFVALVLIPLAWHLKTRPTLRAFVCACIVGFIAGAIAIYAWVGWLAADGDNKAILNLIPEELRYRPRH